MQNCEMSAKKYFKGLELQTSSFVVYSRVISASTRWTNRVRPSRCVYTKLWLDFS